MSNLFRPARIYFNSTKPDPHTGLIPKILNSKSGIISLTTTYNKEGLRINIGNTNPITNPYKNG